MARLTPENMQIIEAHEPAQSDLIAATCNEVYLGNANGCMIIVHEDFAANATPLILTINEGRTEAEALGGLTVFGATQLFMGWFCIDSDTTDALVREPDAITFTLDGVTNGFNSVFVFYIPTAILRDGYDWIQADFAAGNAGNLASVMYVLDYMRYSQETPPSAI